MRIEIDGTEPYAQERVGGWHPSVLDQLDECRFRKYHAMGLPSLCAEPDLVGARIESDVYRRVSAGESPSIVEGGEGSDDIGALGLRSGCRGLRRTAQKVEPFGGESLPSRWNWRKSKLFTPRLEREPAVLPVDWEDCEDLSQ